MPGRCWGDVEASTWLVHLIMHLSMSSPGGGGAESGIAWGFWHFLKEIIKIPTPGQRIIVKISRNKWFTSHLLFKIDTSNAWCQVKIPTLGICITVKFPWVTRPPLCINTGKNNGFPILDILGYLKNTHKNPKFGRVRQIPIREFPTKFPNWDLSHSPKFGIFVGIL